MPLISNFFGVLIKLYFNDDEKHHVPHFHAEYAEYSASFDFDGNVLAGDFPANKKKLVVAWAEIHREELQSLWNLMQTTGEYFKIRGLE